MEVGAPSPAYFLGALDPKGNVSDVARDAVFRAIRARLENRTCADCASRNPTWMSLTYSIFLCLSCSGKHRRMGTHVSFVRSTEMDKFSPEQLLRVELGGNGKARLFFRDHGVLDGKHIDYQTSRVAAKYRQHLDKEVHTALARIRSQVPKESDKLSDLIAEMGPGAPPHAQTPTDLAVLPRSVHTVALSTDSKTPSAPPAAPPQRTNPPFGGTKPSAYHTSAGAGAGLKGQKLEIDFDFEAAASSPPVAPAKFSAPLSTTPKIAVAPPIKSEDVADPNASPTLDRFQASKAISSLQYFDQSDSSRVSSVEVSARFGSLTSISSGSVLGQDGTKDQPNLEDATAAQRTRARASGSGSAGGRSMEHIKENAKKGYSVLKTASNDAVARFGHWMNS